MQPSRSVTPDPATLAASQRAALSTKSSLQSRVGAATNTKFELGVKTFAEIMREKKERKAREMEEKRKSSQESESSAAPARPKIVRIPTVKDRITKIGKSRFPSL